MKKEILIPKYYNDFACIGAKCEDTCCAGWKVSVDKATFHKYRNIGKSELKNELKKIFPESAQIHQTIIMEKLK